METLAQLGILHVAARHFHATKLFCTSKPLFHFVEKLCIFSASGIEMDIHHVPGHNNQAADDLSRLDVEINCPTGFYPQDILQHFGLIGHLQRWSLQIPRSPGSCQIHNTVFLSLEIVTFIGEYWANDFL